MPGTIVPLPKGITPGDCVPLPNGIPPVATLGSVPTGTKQDAVGMTLAFLLRDGKI